MKKGQIEAALDSDQLRSGHAVRLDAELPANDAGLSDAARLTPTHDAVARRVGSATEADQGDRTGSAEARVSGTIPIAAGGRCASNDTATTPRSASGAVSTTPRSASGAVPIMLAPSADAKPLRPRAPAANVAPALWRSVAPLRGVAMCLVVLSHSALLARGMLGPSAASNLFDQVGLQRATLLSLLAPSLSCLLLFIFLSGFMAYRLSASVASSLQNTKQLAQKYLLWAGVGYAAIALLERSVDWHAIGWGLISGGPLSSYWYLTLAIALYALVPLLGPLVRRAPRTALAAAIGIQLACFAEFYSGVTTPKESAAFLILRVVHFLPAFMFGMLASHHSEVLGGLLHRHRKVLRVALPLALAACIAEAFLLGHLEHFYLPHQAHWYAAERSTTVLLGLSVLSVLLVWNFGSGRLAKWFSKVGMSSLGIMLMMDIFTRLAVVLVWHAPSLVTTGSLFGRHGALPEVMQTTAPLFVTVFFVAGIWGPLLVMQYARRFLGARVRFLW